MSLKKLQEKIGADPDGIFGNETLTKAAIYFNKPKEYMVHFFAQCAHETGGFKLFSENLNYSKSGLRKIFGKYFPNDTIAESYARKPEKIANRAYANRIGNGDEASGDGWKYRGRGALQLTGKANYKSFADNMNIPEAFTNPDLVTTEYAFETAIYFFDKNKLWDICKGGINDATILKLTKRINGGTNGLEHRKELTYKYEKYLKL